MEPVARVRPFHNKNFLAALLIMSGFLLLVVSAGYWVIDRAVRHPGPAPIPADVAGLAMIGSLTGSQAVEEISRLHGKGFPLSSGTVGWYGSARQITLWVSGTPLKPISDRILRAMRDRIAEGRSPFTPVAEREEGGRIVYELDGLGQKHFYFQSGNLLVWLAVDADLAEQALSQILEYYP